jgi:dTDP-4-amino-4,6-dideoxygalactose transaminase
MKVPLTRPFAGSKESRLVENVLRSGWLTQGPVTTEFENAVAKYLQVNHAIACSSCTAALFVMMKALGIGPGDEVIAPSFTFIATPNSIMHTGARVKFADIDPFTFNMDPLLVDKAVGPRTRAILAVHQIGIPSDLSALKAIARKRNILLLEDAACALGSELNGKKIGGTGHGLASCFSFHPRKVISTGEGGMIVTNSAPLARKIRMLISHGASVDEVKRHRAGGNIAVNYPEIGYNFRMSDILAAVGLAQMSRLEDLLARRTRCARYYEKKLSGLKGIVTPLIPVTIRWNYQSFALRITPVFGKNRDRVLAYLQKKGVSARGSITCCHREGPYKKHRVKLPHTEQAAQEMIILPLFPGMSTAMQQYVVDALIKSKKEA